jgi:hypothetical protein
MHCAIVSARRGWRLGDDDVPGEGTPLAVVHYLYIARLSISISRAGLGVQYIDLIPSAALSPFPVSGVVIWG